MDSPPKPTEQLGELFQNYQDSLFNMIARLIGSYDEAHDVLQETFLRALQGWGHFRGQAEPRTWLYRIAVNCSYTHLKKAQGRTRSVNWELTAVPTASQAQTEQALVEEERKRLIARALHSLKPELRSVVLLRDMEELSYEEIAAILGWSLGTVASRLNRARRLLGKKLKALGVM